MATHVSLAPTILRRKQVEARTGLSRSTIYAKLRYDPARPGLYDPAFPKPIAIGPRARGWIAGEVDAWVETQIRHSRAEANEARSPDSSKGRARAGRRDSAAVATQQHGRPARAKRQERQS